MAASKILVVSIVVLLAILGVRSEFSTEEEIAARKVSESSLRSEVEALRSKISALESNIADRIREVERKEDSIVELESVIQEKAASIAFLRSEIESFEKTGAVDTEELVGKADARAAELEKQITKLRNDIKAQSEKRVTLEVRASETEKKVKELNEKLKNLQKTNEEQKLRIRKTQRALEVAEKELMRAQLEATSNSKELTEVHGVWLPPWLAAHINYIQDLTATHWNEYAKPAFVLFLQKASEKSEQVQKWAEPHLDTVKTKWIPAVKEQWIVFQTNAGPYLQKLSAKIVEVYETSKSTITPHIVRLQELADPYFQEAKKFAKPYIDQVVIVTKPHVAKVQLVMKPYTKQALRAYNKFLNSAATYHHQVQANIQEKLKKHKSTESLATKELAWFMASASLAFPLFFLYRLMSAIFCSKKARKRTHKTRANHAHRRPKRRHADK